MERIIWTHQSPEPFYVFDETYIVHFWDDGLSIHGANQHYRDPDTRLSPFTGPHFYPKALPLPFYRSAVLDDRLPLSISMEGENLGVIQLTPGGGGAEFGAYERRIVRQSAELRIADGSLVVGLELHASPVDPKTVAGAVGDEDRAPQDHTFSFAFPLDLLPEVLNLTERERRLLEAIRAP